MNPGYALLATFLLLALNAFFVAAEFALTGSRRSRIEPLTATSKAARKVLWSIENLSRMLAAAQLGVTLCSVGLGVMAEPAIAKLIEIPLEALGLAPTAIHGIAFVLALIVVVGLHVVLGEMVPKNISVTFPEKAALRLVPPLLVFEKIFYPVVALLNSCSLLVLRMVGIEPKGEVASAFTADEVASIVEASEAAGVLHDDLGLISGALEFSDHDVRDVMIPVAKVAGVSADVSPESIENAVASTGYSRFLVRDNGGAVCGYVHLKDVLAIPEARRHDPIPAGRIRSLVEVTPGDEVETALKVMRSSGTHLAGVVEQGALVGIVFLEDILEELVGEVRDLMQRD